MGEIIQFRSRVPVVEVAAAPEVGAGLRRNEAAQAALRETPGGGALALVFRPDGGLPPLRILKDAASSTNLLAELLEHPEALHVLPNISDHNADSLAQPSALRALRTRRLPKAS